jgi:hypothetical protein
MLALLPLTTLLLVAGSGSALPGLEAELLLSAPELVLGEPLHATGIVNNASGDSLTLALGGPGGFRVAFHVETADGDAWPCDRPRRLKGEWHSQEEVPPLWTKTYQRTFTCLSQPGEYVIRMVASSAGRQSPAHGDVWSGRIEATARIRMVEPIGEDREAFEAFLGSPLRDPAELRRRFPTSVYAGHAILGGRPWPLNPISELAVREGLLGSAADHEQFAMSEERAWLLQRFLAARPDFVHADFMRLELATRLAYLGRYGEARAQCRRLVTHAAGSTEAAAAEALLIHLEAADGR